MATKSYGELPLPYFDSSNPLALQVFYRSLLRSANLFFQLLPPNADDFRHGFSKFFMTFRALFDLVPSFGNTVSCPFAFLFPARLGPSSPFDSASMHSLGPVHGFNRPYLAYFSPSHHRCVVLASNNFFFPSLIDSLRYFRTCETDLISATKTYGEPPLQPSRERAPCVSTSHTSVLLTRWLSKPSVAPYLDR